MTSTGKAFISGALQARLDKLPHINRAGMKVVENFAIFIDTHRDQPHVGTFGDDIHRGFCRPTKVDYVIGEDSLLNQETGEKLQRHDKHMYVDEDWFAGFLIEWMMSHEGKSPLDNDGMMPTSHLRDPRAKVYQLKSFRQMAMELYNRTVRP